VDRYASLLFSPCYLEANSTSSESFQNNSVLEPFDIEGQAQHCKGKTLLELETTHSANGKGQGIVKGC
jgi:hypothetical protein